MWFTAQSHVTYFYRINIYLAVKIHCQGQCAMDFLKLRLFSLETLQEVQMETVILLSLRVASLLFVSVWPRQHTFVLSTTHTHTHTHTHICSIMWNEEGKVFVNFTKQGSSVTPCHTILQLWSHVCFTHWTFAALFHLALFLIELKLVLLYKIVWQIAEFVKVHDSIHTIELLIPGMIMILIIDPQ